MRGLTIVLAGQAPARLRTALLMTLAQTALGGRARLFLDGAAVAALRLPIVAEDDAANARAGLPTMAALAAEVLDAGVDILLCQSGLALIEAEADAFDARIVFGGLVGVMATLGDDRLVTL